MRQLSGIPVITCPSSAGRGGGRLLLLARCASRGPSSVEFLSKALIKEGADLVKWPNPMWEELSMRAPKWN